MTGTIFTRTFSALTLGLLLSAAFSGIANADSPSSPPPTSGDTRATSFSGNAQTGDCTVGGLSGSDITSHVTFSADGTYIDISAVAAGYSVSGVVVKGGDAYNVYTAASLGTTLPWLDLHSPLNPNARPAGISHWYVCGSTSTTSTDVCTNIDGNQASTPDGMVNANGICSTPPKDVCTNINGVQTSIPSGMTAANGVCTTTTTTTTTTNTTTAPPTTVVEDTAVESTSDTEVKGVKKSSKPPAAVLPRTGLDLDATGLAAIGLGLLLAGILLVTLPARPAFARGLHRRG